jgi:hypothetical protein
MKRLALVITATMTALMAGCTSQPAITFQPTSDYVYTLRSSCGERLLHGTMRLTVHDGKVTAAQGLDEPGEQTVAVAKKEDLPTLSALIAEYGAARANGADVLEADFTPDGVPVRISIDPQRNAIDDEACYYITDYRPA